MMMCVEFVKDKQSKELFDEELDIGKLVSNQAETRGLILRPVGNLNVMSPPLVLTSENVDFFVETLRESILATQEELQIR
jgi:adenosylmethionine-8-amino-7-oxononanoate aminotransferase